jgi:D-alanyl-D-alanine carboxypeptidase (penicillin-binding protein 5/6)
MNNFESMQKKELAILVTAFVLPLFILSFIFLGKEPKELVKKSASNVDENKEYVITPNIQAQSAKVTELNTGKVLYAKNQHDEKAIASITKLMTVLVANEKFEKQEISKIRIQDNHLTAFGDSGLVQGQLWNVNDLIDFTLITSSNDGAKALALSAFGEQQNSFVAEMNSLSRRIGLTDTFFSNETGLDLNLDTEAGAVSTADDITKILKYITDNKINVFKHTTLGEKTIVVDDLIYEIENTNKSIKELPGSLLSKTGYTDVAGGNLAVVADFGLNNPVSIVVLDSTLESREYDVKELFKEVQNYYSSNLFE